MRAARIVAWVGVVLSVVLAPFWIGLLRDVLLVGCETVMIGGDVDTVCQDGNGYILPGLPLAALGVLASIALVVLHARFRARPSVVRWRLQAVPVIVPAVAAGFLVVEPFLSLLMVGGVVLVLLGMALGTRRVARTLLLLAAAIVFVVMTAASVGAAPLACLGASVALVLALGRASVEVAHGDLAKHG